MKEIQGKSILVTLGFELSGVACSLFYLWYCILLFSRSTIEPRIVNMSFLPPPLLVLRLFAGRKIISLVFMLNFTKFVVCCSSS